MNKLSSMLKFLVESIGNTAMGTTATTLTGAIKELLDKITGRKIIWRTYTFSDIGIGANLVSSAARNIAYSGYKPIAIAGWQVVDHDVEGRNSGWCVVDRLWLGAEVIDGTTTDAVVYTVWNQNTTQSARVKLMVRIAYVSADVFPT